MTGVFVGIKPCGCAVAAFVAEPDPAWPDQNQRRYRADVAREVSRWIRDGFRVERWTVERVRLELAKCTHEAAKRPSSPRAEQVALL